MKKIMYIFGIEGKEYTHVLPTIEGSREICKKIISTNMGIELEQFDSDQFKIIDNGDNIKAWKSNFLQFFPKKKLGKVSGYCIVESFLESGNEEIKGHEIFMGYYDDNPKFKGETDDVDFYVFIGFSDEEMIKCGTSLADYWELVEEI